MNHLLLASLYAWMILGTSPALSQGNHGNNLLLNPAFDFHSFANHRDGERISYASHNVAFWNTDDWGDIQVVRESHVSEKVRPAFSTHNLVAIYPGKKIWQFFTLPEAGLAHGDLLDLSVYGFQNQANSLEARIKLMKLDSEDGEWSPKDYGMSDTRTFPRHSRGELVVAKTYPTSDEKTGTILLEIRNAEIDGKISIGNQSNSRDVNTIGIRVEFRNNSTDTVWVYSPKLSVTNHDPRQVSTERNKRAYYRHIPKTIQKLWKGETIHVIVMGSSIDVGSANPPMYFYDEDPESVTFKQPLAEGLFDAKIAARQDLADYFGQWRHYFTYAGRLKRELMRKYNVPADKICLNFMAEGGSAVGESHSGLKEYCALLIPPSPGMNGHGEGRTWQELYPELFSRPRGPSPDLVIFGSGANEKTDTPDEVAVFEGAIRWIQQHHPGTEFLFCQFQNFGGYTPNPGDMQALSLRYQIPFVDYGKAGDDITRWCNRFALVPADGHPQAAAHYLWFKQLEQAFESWDPIFPGQVQLHLPERLHANTYGWEGEMTTFDSTSSRIRGNRFIFEDQAINSWGKVENEPPVPYVDGIKMTSRRSLPQHNLRNSVFRHGRTTLGDRHILELSGKNAKLTFVDAKVNPNRRFFPMDNPNWDIAGNRVQDFDSEWGAPYGQKKILLTPGEAIAIEALCTDLSIAYVDGDNGGLLEVFVDDSLRLSQPTNIGFVDTDNRINFLENRKGILHLGFGLHKIRLEARDTPVAILGLFTYDARSNRNAERRLIGYGIGGETISFAVPFKARPMVICSGGLTVDSKDIFTNQVKFSGSKGSYEVIGE